MAHLLSPENSLSAATYHPTSADTAKGTIALIPGFLQTVNVYRHWVSKLNENGFDVVTISLNYRRDRVTIEQQAEEMYRNLKLYNYAQPLVVIGYRYILS